MGGFWVLLQHRMEQACLLVPLKKLNDDTPFIVELCIYRRPYYWGLWDLFGTMMVLMERRGWRLHTGDRSRGGWLLADQSVLGGRRCREQRETPLRKRVYQRAAA